MNWNVFRANWIINDYAASLRRYGPCPPERWPLIWVWLRLWFLGAEHSQVARQALRQMVRP